MMLLVLFLFSTLAVAAPLDLPLNLDTFRNLTATNRCSDSADWQAYAFLVEDCYAAVQRLYIEDVLRKPDISFEFISRYGHHRTKRPWIRTPAQISVSESSSFAFHVSYSQEEQRKSIAVADENDKDSCILTIMMLDWFGLGTGLPGRAGTGHEPTDTATLRDIYRAVRGVEEDCLLPRRQPGWDAVGETHHQFPSYLVPVPSPRLNDLPGIYLTLFARAGTKSSIGVFLWAADSSINAQVMGRGGNAVNDLPNLISPNASSIVENDIDSRR